MKLLDEYLKLQQEIYEYFGYVEQWRVIPIDDRRECYWWLNGDEEVIYADRLEDFDESVGNYYSDEIYTQRHHSKWVYRGKDYTMIMVDTNTDGNKFLAIYDNNKEVPDNPFFKE